MSTTVRECLENAMLNLESSERICALNPLARIAKNQLDNAMIALGNGMGLDDVIQESLAHDVKTKP